MDLVFDIQCVKNANNIDVRKEVAVVSVLDDYICNWILAPPYTSKKLPNNIKTTNKWLSRNKHGLEWEDGYITKPALTNHLREITKNFDKIFVRGNEKKKILEGMVYNEVINLAEEREDESFPAFAELAWFNTRCILHAARRKSSTPFSCALNRAECLKNWLKKERENNEQFRDFEFAFADTTAYGGCIPCWQNCRKMDKTVCICFQYR